ALVDRTGDHAWLAWQLLMLALTCIALWMIADMVWRWTGLVIPAITAAIAVAILPGTLFYSLWLFYTQPVAALLVVTAWGVVRGCTLQRQSGFLVSVLAMTGLFLIRSSFVWPVALIWIGAVIWIGSQRLRGDQRSVVPLVIVSAFAFLIIGSLTAKNIVIFGSYTQSSWSAENYGKALIHTMDDAQVQQVTQDNRCFVELSSVGSFQPSSHYPICLNSGYARLDLPASQILDTPMWSNGDTNFNDRDRLVLAQAWAQFDSHALRTNPALAVAVLVRSSVTTSHGSIVTFAWPSADYPFLHPNTDKLGRTGRLWMIGTAWIPLVAMASWILFSLLSLARVRLRTFAFASYLLVGGLMAYLGLAYLLLEVGENQRFQAELDPLAIALGATAITQIFVHIRQKRIAHRRSRVPAPDRQSSDGIPESRA
ncbi:MAG: hypothetical protein WC005_03655, partial [Candidatus Nanopelagicales bacterium]